MRSIRDFCGELRFRDLIDDPYPERIYSFLSHGYGGILVPVQTNQAVGGIENFSRGSVVSEEIELAGFGIDVSDPVDLIRQGAFEGKDGLVVVEEEGDVGFFRGKTLDQLYLNRIQILGFINQDVGRRCCVLPFVL